MRKVSALSLVPLMSDSEEALVGSIALIAPTRNVSKVSYVPASVTNNKHLFNR